VNPKTHSKLVNQKVGPESVANSIPES